MVRKAKGGKARTVPFGPMTGAAIDRYMRLRRRHLLAEERALSLGERSRRFGNAALYKSLKQRGLATSVRFVRCLLTVGWRRDVRPERGHELSGLDRQAQPILRAERPVHPAPVRKLDHDPHEVAAVGIPVRPRHDRQEPATHRGTAALGSGRP